MFSETRSTKRKRTTDALDDKQNHSEKIAEVLNKQWDEGISGDARNVARSRWHSVAAVMLMEDTPLDVLNYYMHKAATEIELAMRNRDSASLGAVDADIQIPIEIDTEIERRLDQYMKQCEQLEECRSNDSYRPEDIAMTEHECKELLHTLKVYQAMSNLLSGRGSNELVGELIVPAQALFFCLVCMSRELQAMMFSRQHRWRMPGHVAVVDQDAICQFMTALKTVTPLYTANIFDAQDYVEALRKFVFWGSLELDEFLDWQQRERQQPTEQEEETTPTDNDSNE